MQSKGIRLINAYGPTENTVCVSMSDDPIKDNHVTVIGKPISNVQVYILDKEGIYAPLELQEKYAWQEYKLHGVI